jgi:hypothetical protein
MNLLDTLQRGSGGRCSERHCKHHSRSLTGSPMGQGWCAQGKKQVQRCVCVVLHLPPSREGSRCCGVCGAASKEGSRSSVRGVAHRVHTSFPLAASEKQHVESTKRKTERERRGVQM